MSDQIKGIKLIYQTGERAPDDPSIPYKLGSESSTTVYDGRVHRAIRGSVEIVVRGESREVLEKFIEANQLQPTAPSPTHHHRTKRVNPNPTPKTKIKSHSLRHHGFSTRSGSGCLNMKKKTNNFPHQ